MTAAAKIRDKGHGDVVSFSKKVFIPLTRLCRDVCHYCTYAKTPRHIESPYMTRQQVLDVARAGQVAGCKEALFTLGDKPELRYRVAREALDALECETTLQYVAQMAELVFCETGLLPHINAGVMSAAEIEMFRDVSVSQGLMLESSATRLSAKGGPHFGSPDKDPELRLQVIREAGRLKVPFTTGILIGIGETRDERLQTLQAIQDLHREFGHIQEIIVQNFRAKPNTKMADAPEPSIDELLWTVEATRLMFGPDMNIQVPPNLNRGEIKPLIDAGINDWGGVSPVTPDFVNPEAPWPQLSSLARQTQAAGKTLVERLAIYPAHLLSNQEWLAPRMRSAALKYIDGRGLVREENWSPGETKAVPPKLTSIIRERVRSADGELQNTLSRARNDDPLTESMIVNLFNARGDAVSEICDAADRLRREVSGDAVTYVINRNINYTNVCYYKCSFCAFSKGKHSEQLRGKSYNLDLQEIVRRAGEAVARGATEVCMQGGIHPKYTGDTYLNICRALREEFPNLHIHAFSALEVQQGAQTLGLSIHSFLEKLRDAGLNSLPGTAAEVLDDEIRAMICPDKINTREWLEVISAAHDVGLKTTSTIMFGHVDEPRHWARHLMRLRDLQIQSGGITEFVPLPFVHAEAPMYLKGLSRKGPTFRESLLMHAVSRLILHPHITNIQTSWVKMGVDGAKACLQAGCNDLGGTLMNESISRAAGSTHGQELSPASIELIVADLGRDSQQRGTFYQAISGNKSREKFKSQILEPIVNTPVGRRNKTNALKSPSNVFSTSAHPVQDH
jgi:FO synthase